MSSDQGGTGTQIVKAQMTPNEWVKVITQLLTLLVGLGGLTALLGIKDKQPSPNTPLPVVPVVAPVNPSPNPSPSPLPLTPIVQPTNGVTKEDVAKMLSDSEARILNAFDEKLKAFEQ